LKKFWKPSKSKKDAPLPLRPSFLDTIYSRVSLTIKMSIACL